MDVDMEFFIQEIFLKVLVLMFMEFDNVVSNGSRVIVGNMQGF